MSEFYLLVMFCQRQATSPNVIEFPSNLIGMANGEGCWELKSDSVGHITSCPS